MCKTFSWDTNYHYELVNYQTNPADQGTVWFEDSGAEEKIQNYLTQLKFDHDDSSATELPDVTQDQSENKERQDLRILDLGTGNGHMLFALRDDGWRTQMLGVDYSEASVELAKSINRARRAGNDDRHVGGTSIASDVAFEVWDVLKNRPGRWLDNGFDLVLDKGTFDAVSLNSDALEGAKKPSELYTYKATDLVRKGGYFLVTSCNWTAQELRNWFEGPDLAFHDVISFPSFSFGGQRGQSVSSVCFKRGKA